MRNFCISRAILSYILTYKITKLQAMKITQHHWTNENGWQTMKGEDIAQKAQLVIAFGQREVMENPSRFEEIRKMYPTAGILSASTSGEILDNEVFDESIALTSVFFEKTALQFAKTNSTGKESKQIGNDLAAQFPLEGLKHVFVLSEGSTVNGTALVEGMIEKLGTKITITGGLAGDGAAFQKTIVGYNEAPQAFEVVAVGFYGDDLTVGYGSFGGWDTFGAERQVTKSAGNILYELDDKPALDLYKLYLGDKAAELPASALLFPLCIIDAEGNSLVRTILTINEEEKSMVFAGDIPQGCKVKLMKSNHNKLIEGAGNAASNSLDILGKEASLGLLVSCVGRKLVLKQRVEEEIEAVRDILGEQASLMGFYSYGELAPTNEDTPCYLHNQTMTVTLLTEN